MAEPSLGDVHVDSALTDYSAAYFQNASNFAATAIPAVATAKQSDKYFIYNKADTLRTDAEKRAPGTPAAERTYTLSQGSFFCDVYSIAQNVSEQVAANADPALDPEEDAARVNAEDIRIRMEVDFATLVTGTTWGTTVTGGTDFTQWSSASATPIEDMATGIDTVEDNTGQTPNWLILGSQVWKSLRHHPDIIARLPDNAPRIATEAFLANLLDLDRVVISRAIRNTANEGATASLSRVLGSHALLAKIDPSPGLRVATAVRKFVWTGLVGSVDGVRTKRFDMPYMDAYPRIETDAAYDFVATGTDLGYYFASASA